MDSQVEIKPRTLTQMQRHVTAYEVVACHEDGTEHRLAFSERKTKSVLLKIAARNGDTILPLLGDWDDLATYNKDSGWTFGPVTICFSGRTERDVASAMNLI